MAVRIIPSHPQFRLALNASKQGHEAANKALQEDINNMFNQGNKNAI